jgi:hypothetical protein
LVAVPQPRDTWLERGKPMETYMWVVLAVVVLGGIVYYMMRRA